MELKSVIINETNEILYFTENMTDEEVEAVLKRYPEANLSTIEV